MPGKDRQKKYFDDVEILGSQNVAGALGVTGALTAGALATTGNVAHTGALAARGQFSDKRTQTALTDTATVTAAQLLTKIIDGTPTAGATYTLPTAALLVAAMTDAKVGDTIEFLVNNKAGGAFTITMQEGAGGTSDGTLTVAQNVIRKFVVMLTNVTASSEAYILYGLGA